MSAELESGAHGSKPGNASTEILQHVRFIQRLSLALPSSAIQGSVAHSKSSPVQSDM
jgi:hypothetical protein